jgi:hypothetical protein
MSVTAIKKNGNGDEYYTPKYIVEILLPYIKAKGYKNIWCPFDKEWSEYVKVFKDEGFNVFHTHIDYGEDFFKVLHPPHDIIISNPPFSLKHEIFEKLINMKVPFAILMSATSIQSAKLMKILSKAENLKFIMFDKRISYDGDRPPFPSWYFTNLLLNKNEFYIYKEDPKKLYKDWQNSLSIQP